MAVVDLLIDHMAVGAVEASGRLDERRMKDRLAVGEANGVPSCGRDIGEFVTLIGSFRF